MSALQTVDEFCRDNGLSRPMFYKLRRQGKAPRITKLGKLTRISSEAAAEWRRRMEHETASPSGAR
jgi:predicted DNA-binding transcriptional regulator AlpA